MAVPTLGQIRAFSDLQGLIWVHPSFASLPTLRIESMLLVSVEKSVA